MLSYEERGLGLKLVNLVARITSRGSEFELGKVLSWKFTSVYLVIITVYLTNF